MVEWLDVKTLELNVAVLGDNNLKRKKLTFTAPCKDAIGGVNWKYSDSLQKFWNLGYV